MEQVCDSRAPLLVTRQNARSVVMVSEEEYEGLMETLHLLRMPKRLLKSMKEANAASLVEHELVEPKAKSAR